MKALILAGGRGSRLKELTESINKCMHPYQGRPLIEYSLRSAVSAAVEEILIVVSYQAESIINYFGNSYEGIPIKYIIQWERKGLVHAIECSKEAIDGRDFMLFLADEMLFNPKHVDMFHYYSEQNVFALCGAVRVEDMSQIKKTYAIIYDEQTHQIYRLIEKPRRPLNHWMGTGNCVFKNQIFEYIPFTPINQNRNEKELPDLIQCAIDDGQVVKFFNIGGDYVNINTVEDINKLQDSV